MDFIDNSCYYQSRSMIKQMNNLEPMHFTCAFIPPGCFVYSISTVTAVYIFNDKVYHRIIFYT